MSAAGADGAMAEAANETPTSEKPGDDPMNADEFAKTANALLAEGLALLRAHAGEGDVINRYCATVEKVRAQYRAAKEAPAPAPEPSAPPAGVPVCLVCGKSMTLHLWLLNGIVMCPPPSDPVTVATGGVPLLASKLGERICDCGDSEQEHSGPDHHCPRDQGVFSHARRPRPSDAVLLVGGHCSGWGVNCTWKGCSFRTPEFTVAWAAREAIVDHVKATHLASAAPPVPPGPVPVEAPRNCDDAGQRHRWPDGRDQCDPQPGDECANCERSFEQVQAEAAVPAVPPGPVDEIAPQIPHRESPNGSCYCDACCEKAGVYDQSPGPVPVEACGAVTFEGAKCVKTPIGHAGAHVGHSEWLGRIQWWVTPTVAPSAAPGSEPAPTCSVPCLSRTCPRTCELDHGHPPDRDHSHASRPNEAGHTWPASEPAVRPPLWKRLRDAVRSNRVDARGEIDRISFELEALEDRGAIAEEHRGDAYRTYCEVLKERDAARAEVEQLKQEAKDREADWRDIHRARLMEVDQLTAKLASYELSGRDAIARHRAEEAKREVDVRVLAMKLDCKAIAASYAGRAAELIAEAIERIPTSSGREDTPELAAEDVSASNAQEEVSK
jgi:hypothetical protein